MCLTYVCLRSMFSKLISKFSPRAGFTMIEVVLVIGITLITGALIITSLQGRKGKTELDATVRQAVSLLREAQSRSVSQASSSAWGVRFENSTNTIPHFMLFAGTFSTSSQVAQYPISSAIGVSTSTLPLGSSTDIIFLQISGVTANTTTLQFYRKSDSAQSSTITVLPSGSVSY